MLNRLFMIGVYFMLSTNLLFVEAKANGNTRVDYSNLPFSYGQNLAQTNPKEWQVINDGVMGGLSKGEIRLENHGLKFNGSISTQNNGGFTSVYQSVPEMPQQVSSVKINVKGDGKLYQLRLRSRVMGYDLAYKINVPTKIDTLQVFEFSLADFQASFRGRIITDAPILKAETISHVGFLVTAKQVSTFALSISGIEFY
jgi:hypothetical protein